MIRNICTWLLALLSCCILRAQSTTVNNVEKPDFRNSGAIMNGALVRGYYLLYQHKDDASYHLLLTGENLVTIRDIEFRDTKTLWMIEAGYNNELFCFLLYDKVSETLITKLYDLNGTEVKEYRQIVRNGKKLFDKKEADNQWLYDLDKTGFISVLPIKDDGVKTFVVNYYGTRQSWSYKPAESADLQNITADFFSFTEGKIILQVQKKEKRAKNFDVYLTGLDIATGQKVFESSLENNDYLFNPVSVIQPYNAVPSMLVIGYYYDKNEKKQTEYGEGIAFLEVDMQGKILRTILNGWDEDFRKLVNMKGNGKIADFGFMYVHHVIQTNDGRLYAAVEGYKRQVNGWYTTLNVLSTLGGRPHFGNNTKIKVTDFALLEFDSSYKIRKVDVYEKDGRSMMGADFISQHSLAKTMDNKGYFDYNFTVKDSTSDHFAVYYTCKQKLEDFKGKVVSAICYNGNGTYAYKKYKLASEPTRLKVLPNNPGKVLLMEYYKSDQNIQLHTAAMDDVKAL